LKLHGPGGRWREEAPISDEEQEARDELRAHLNCPLPIIVATMNTWTPGDIIPGTMASIRQNNGTLKNVYVKQPFMIRAERTFEEWINSTPPWMRLVKVTKAQAQGYRFYEITTD
jgi:hypothetical protein